MNAAELGRFVRERFPDIRACLNAGLLPKSDMPDLLSALDCAMGVLRQCYDAMEHSGGPGWNPPGELEATLRLVLGEEGKLLGSCDRP